MKRIWLLALLTIWSVGVYATEAEKDTTVQSEHETAKFEPGKFIIEHISDSYEWHILTYGQHHVSIPLPVLLYSQHTGFHVFMSSKFHHGQEPYNGFHISHDEPNKGKIVEDVMGEMIVPLDISLTKNVVSIWFSLIIITVLFISIARTYKRNPASAPKGLQNALEIIILFVRDDIVKASIQGKKHEKYLPFLLTLFFFILINNLLGLVPIFPGGANVTGNIAVTMVLALITFLITTFSGNKAYWLHIFNAPGVPWWLKFPLPLIPLIEFLGIFIKPFVLMVRLFANITAGHIIVLGFFSLIFIFGNLNMFAGYGVSVISIAFTIFMTVLELLVAFIQAYVFTLLSAIYFGMATEEHLHHEEHHH